MSLDPDRLDWLRRNSRVTLDREGRFYFQGALVEHPRVQRLFHRGLRPAEGGAIVLQVGEQWCYLESVEDTAWFVEKAAVAGDRVLLTLADGSTEALDPATLSRRDDRIYCVLSHGRRARFLRAALLTLAPWIDEDAAGEQEAGYGLRLPGGFHRVRAE